MKDIKIFFVLLIFVFYSCKILQKQEEVKQTVNLDTINVIAKTEIPRYNPSRKIINDIINTKLDVKFNWDKQYLYGKAEITFKPHFYSVDTLTLDAKNFDINEVKMISDSNSYPIKYKYDNKQLKISLGKNFTRNDTLKVFIDYVAKPEEGEHEGSSAISSDKGLYFINPKGEIKDKPKEIWTQGETESNSRWFPTIDSPNEKMTNEICITVDTVYETLSNGLLEFSTINSDGTRTDCWKQSLPHSPYLVMMAIGDYAIVKDKWRNIDVNYYIEKKYKKYAHEIFGNTPEMLEFFSKILHYNYPWEKFSQVIVRDYVSGAMENTTAVVHGEFLQQTHREMIDNNYEDVIAHELFHHWFGNLVTCESWANLPLNESFATYGEYLWYEYKYGRDAADNHLQNDLEEHFAEAKSKQVSLIRFDYEDKEDMFDSYSYQKGARVLHMLRKYVGDDAFFNSLAYYLKTNEFQPVEIHNLRLAFEKITGEDLNWFFNEWFFHPGYPILNIKYDYQSSYYDTVFIIDSTGNKETKLLNVQKPRAIVIVEQKQDLDKFPLYKLPVDIDIYIDEKKERKRVVINKEKQKFIFNVSKKPDLINFDAEKMLLAKKEDNHSIKEWIYMYNHAALYMDRYEAISNLEDSNDTLAMQTIIKALDDKYWNIRKLAIKKAKNTSDKFPDLLKNKLLKLAKCDENTKVRSSALKYLHEYFPDEDFSNLYVNALQDSSYYVISTALKTLKKVDIKKAEKAANKLENEDNEEIISTIADIYALTGKKEYHNFFIKHLKTMSGYVKYVFIKSYSSYLNKLQLEESEKGIDILAGITKNDPQWWIRLSAMEALNNLHKKIKEKIEILEENSQNNNENDLNNLNHYKETNKKISSLIKDIKENEKDKRLQQIYSNYF